VSAILARRKPAGDGLSALSEADSKDLLRAYGIQAPREIAARIGIATPQLDRLYALTRLMGENLGLL
jgi:hypothetical protein